MDSKLLDLINNMEKKKFREEIILDEVKKQLANAKEDWKKIEPKIIHYPTGTTKEQWDKYELDLQNHEARIAYQRDFLNNILMYCEANGFNATKQKFESELDRALSMDAPNKPGYYRANND